MKKITLKISAFLLLTMFALQLQGQALWTENGIYKISTSGITPVLYLTIDLTATPPAPFVNWQEELPGDDERQLFNIIPHRTPATAGLMEITANITGVGNVTLCTADDSGHPNLTLTVRPGDPIEVAFDGSDPDPANWVYSGDHSGLDQFQRRKTKVDENGLADPTGTNPANGNNALFLKNTIGTNSRYGVIPSAAGDPVQFDGGGIDVIQFHLVQSLSVEEFDEASIFISNPVKDELTIEGEIQNIKQVSVYSLLGQRVMFNDVENNVSSIKLDVSSLNSGVYIVKMDGENYASFSKKIVKE